MLNQSLDQFWQLTDSDEQDLEDAFESKKTSDSFLDCPALALAELGLIISSKLLVQAK